MYAARLRWQVRQAWVLGQHLRGLLGSLLEDCRPARASLRCADGIEENWIFLGSRGQLPAFPSLLLASSLYWTTGTSSAFLSISTQHNCASQNKDFVVFFRRIHLKKKQTNCYIPVIFFYQSNCCLSQGCVRCFVWSEQEILKPFYLLEVWSQNT